MSLHPMWLTVHLVALLRVCGCAGRPVYFTLPAHEVPLEAMQTELLAQVNAAVEEQQTAGTNLSSSDSEVADRLQWWSTLVRF